MAWLILLIHFFAYSVQIDRKPVHLKKFIMQNIVKLCHMCGIFGTYTGNVMAYNLY